MLADPKIRQQLAAPDRIRLAPPCTTQRWPTSVPLKFNAKQQTRDARQGKPLKMDAIRTDSTRRCSARLIIISEHGLHLIPATLGDNGSLSHRADTDTQNHIAAASYTLRTSYGNAAPSREKNQKK
ncbi:hypothetical protein AWZ03_005370 [Drosophila navojoa]|uniref:Uncharacterized protein n=1 Tax=Drosophila navojoa TaxID=7232 RepID=A0A484BK58_DRONA|nr:hypothetical protein AWZ03_005370 [Drosophila navojoa]